MRVGDAANHHTAGSNGQRSHSVLAVKESFERHLTNSLAQVRYTATQLGRYNSLALAVRDQLIRRWLNTQQAYDNADAKRVYYLSLEFLLGRMLGNNLINLQRLDESAQALREFGYRLEDLREVEWDAGLGNGGLGRLAACFLDSLATLQIPAIGYGLRYEYGIFRQDIKNGYQVEQPDNWLREADPWEVSRTAETVTIPLGCTFRLENGALHAIPRASSHLLGVPYDRPIVGYGGSNINTLRLWGAASPDFFHFDEFSAGDFVGALVRRAPSEMVTRVLYPDDSTTAGQLLRFLQEYFLVCCSLADIVARFRRDNADWHALPDKVAIQLNDTHPAMAVPEMMRLLLDDAGLGWDDAWKLTVGTLAYTNHTLLPEALE